MARRPIPRGWVLFAAAGLGAVLIGGILAPRPSTGPVLPPRTVPRPVDEGPKVLPPSGATWVQAGAIANPAWSYDGKWLAWEVSGPGPDDLTVWIAKIVDGVGEDPRAVELPGGGRTLAPTWAREPDLALMEGQARGEAMRIFAMVPDGSSPSALIDESTVKGVLSDPAFSPSGDRIAFIDYETGDGDVRVWHRGAATLDSPVITDAIESTPSWSPDGARIAAGRAVGGDENIAVLDLATSTYAPVAAGPGSQLRPTWGADGSVVYFDSPDGERWSVVAWLGDTARTLASDVRLPVRAAPALTPDRAWLAWTADQSASDVVHLTNLADGRIVDVSTGLSVAAEPAVGETADHRLWLASVGRKDGVRALAVREIRLP